MELLPAGVIARSSYIDTIRLTQHHQFPKDVFNALRQSLAPQKGCAEKRLLVAKSPLPIGKVVHMLTLHQPTPQTFDVLEAIRDRPPFLPGFALSRVDISLDLLVERNADANGLLRFIVARLVPKEMRPRTGWRYEGGFTGHACVAPEQGTACTAYLGYESKGTRLAVYSSRSSKAHPGLPCVHIEWRLMGAEAVQRSGLGAVEALRTLDHKAFWDSRLRMIRSRDIGNFTGARESSTQDRLIQMASPSHVALRRADLFSSLKHAWMLPARENALWDSLYFDDLHHEKIITALPARKVRRFLLEDAPVY